MKVSPWMVGLGIVGVGGVVVYLATRKSTATATPLPAAAPTPASSGVPTVIFPGRPIASSATGSFSTNPPPPGEVLTVAPGAALSAPLNSAESNVTLVLPAGAAWSQVVIGNTANPAVATGQINLNGDTASPIALSMQDMIGANLILAVWTDSSGARQMTTVSTPLVVAPKPLVF